MNPSLVVLHILRRQPCSLSSMQRLLRKHVDSALLGRIWHALRESGQILPVDERPITSASYTRYRTAAGIQLQMPITDVVPADVLAALGITPQPASKTAEELHEARCDAVITVLARAGKPIPPRRIYMAMPARPGGKTCDYTTLSKLLSDMLYDNRISAVGVGAGRCYSLGGAQ